MGYDGYWLLWAGLRRRRQKAESRTSSKQIGDGDYPLLQPAYSQGGGGGG
jgi:hypothetical protein